MSKVIVYIAASLDGYIARKDDDVSWLESYQVAAEDYGHSDFIKAIRTVIMGARTYDQSIKHHVQPSEGIRTLGILPLLGAVLPSFICPRMIEGDVC
jgi:dihydrofolate reductase